MEEREIKFLPENQNYSGKNGKKIRQVYLELSNEKIIKAISNIDPQDTMDQIAEIRIKIEKNEEETETKRTLTFKNEGGESREEYEMEINEALLNELLKFSSKEGVDKERYYHELTEDLTAEIDVYMGKLEGLVTVEVEYDQEQYSKETVEEMIEDLVGHGKIVSEYQCFKNKNLAKCKSVEDIYNKYAEEKENKELDLKTTEECFQVKKIALTGGPCAGKTEVLSALKSEFGQRLCVMPEVATQLLEIPYERGGIGIPGKDLEWSQEWQDEFQRRIIEKQLEDETLLTQIASLSDNISVLLCDRGVMDGAAYTDGGREKFLEQQNLQLDKCLELYDAVIHLNSLATDSPELYENLKATNPNRFENGDTARKLDAAIASAYEGHKNLIRIPTQPTIEEKIAYCRQIIENVGSIKKENTKEMAAISSETNNEQINEIHLSKNELKY